MKLFRLVTGWASALLIALAPLSSPGPGPGAGECFAASPSSEWDQPAASLAEQVAAVLGPAQASLTLRNRSSIADSKLPAIRALLENDLKSHGVAIASGDSANIVRVTLSQNDRQRLWVAEIVEGNETRVVMVLAGSEAAQARAAADYMTLRRERLPITNVLHSNDPVLAAFDAGTTLVILHPNTVQVLAFTDGAWEHQKYFGLNETRQLSRDARGIMIPSTDRTAFTAYTGQTECSGVYSASAINPVHPATGWTIHCNASDEPWPITTPISAQAGATTMQNIRGTPVKAFFNAARNYFTGVLSPNVGIDLPPFYSFAEVPRATASVAWLIGGIDGKVQIVDNGVLKPVTGARDWGSDFALLKSGCGSGAQVIASGSGEAPADSLRAYELPAQEAIPASAPLAMNGAVTALWTAPDGKSLLASLRLPSGDYEVDRVTALCN